ncbi:MAG TPA: twin-arginine translocation signal domain-containing protein, partial [Chloroflexota bacterium]|nr:twin-arginine translocation signal domain-containing protein [Chloroflexota bacterium]
DESTPSAAPSAPRRGARRRQVLGGAAVLGVGAVLAALYEAHPLQQSASPLPDSVRLGHLLRRAGFGASPEELATYQLQGIAATTTHLLNY